MQPVVITTINNVNNAVQILPFGTRELIGKCLLLGAIWSFR